MTQPVQYPMAHRGSTNTALMILLVLVLLAVFAGLAWYQLSPRQANQPVAASSPLPIEAVPDAEPRPGAADEPAGGAAPRAIETEPQTPTIVESDWPQDAPQPSQRPTLTSEQVDAELLAGIAQSLESELSSQIAQSRLVERLVVTINSLDRDGVPLRMRPMAHVPGLPNVVEMDEGWRLPSDSDPRYDVYRDLLDQLEPEQMVALYQRYQSSFEQAWLALGQTETSFDRRLIEVIDHLLAFDYPATPPELIRPEVLYEYADPALEQATAGHKLLMRIGPAHGQAVQELLREVRGELTTVSTMDESSTGA